MGNLKVSLKYLYEENKKVFLETFRPKTTLHTRPDNRNSFKAKLWQNN